MKRVKMMTLGVLALLLAACSNNAAFEPQQINPEIDVCQVCNMGLSEEAFATQLISKEGEAFKFDDIGCMIEFVMKEKGIAEEDIEKQYVRDHNTGKWVELEDAYYVYHPDFWTPMANGVLSFKEKEDAEAYIKEKGMGMVMDYNGLYQHKWSWQ